MRRAGHVAAALALIGLAATGAGAADLRVLSAGAVKTVVSAIADDFRRETGHTVTLTTGTAGALKQKVVGGEPADAIIATDTALAELARAGEIAGGVTDVARVGVGVAVRQGDPPPDVSTVEAFRRALLAARAIVYNDPASGATSGIYVHDLIDRLGLREPLKDKVVLWPGGYACEALTRGRADLCVHQISEILAVPGVMLVGPLPPEVQKVTTYAAGVLRRSAAPAAARAFVDFVARPAFRARFADAGLDYQAAAPSKR